MSASTTRPHVHWRAGAELSPSVYCHAWLIADNFCANRSPEEPKTGATRGSSRGSCVGVGIGVGREARQSLQPRDFGSQIFLFCIFSLSLNKDKGQNDREALLWHCPVWGCRGCCNRLWGSLSELIQGCR